MKLIDIFKTASSNLWRNKGRTILTIVAIFVGAFTIALTTGVNQGVSNYIDKQIGSVGGDNQLMIMPESLNENFTMSTSPKEYDPEKNDSQDGDMITEKKIRSIEKIKDIKSVEPFTYLTADYIKGSANQKYALNVAGPSNLTIALAEGRGVKKSSNTFEIVLAQEYVKSLGFKNNQAAVGKTVEIAATNKASGKQEIVTAKVVGVRAASLIQGGQSIVSRGLEEKIVEINEAGLPDSIRNQYQMVYATLPDNISDEKIATIQNDLKKIGLDGMTVEDQIGTIQQVVSAVTGILTLFGGIALIAASFGIINTLYMSVQDRTREIGLMKAVGLKRSKVFLTFSFEALLIGFWGALIGIGCAMGLGSLINNIARQSFLSGMTGFSLVEFPLSSMVIILLIIMFIAFLAGTLPANRAAKLNPINALRYE
ncbi:ABC transporter permease [Enterococcus sp. AZ103]|uniref:ABC transporter permease n=1 Tax=Enterococcus sp. AZ103 TaxID=2774628 RepID=UPI003F24EA3A